MHDGVMGFSFDITILGKRDTFKNLAWLGRYDWMNPKAVVGTRGITSNMKFPEFDAYIPQADYSRVRNTAEFLLNNNLHNELFWMWTQSKLFASGPKVFCPTYEQCLAMSEVEIDIPFQDYHQPYPVIIYQYPKQFAEEMKEKLGCTRFPEIAVCHHENDLIQVSSLFNEKDAITAIIPYREGETIESILKRRPYESEDDAEFKLGEILQRIALNFSLMMTHYNVKHAPSDPSEWRRLSQMAKKSNPQKRAMGEKLLLSQVSIIEFEQHIDMYEVRDETPRGEGDATGRVIKPHWRKGHWRMQAHGPQLSLRRRQFIKPVMVKKEVFIGEYSDTTVVYQGKNAPQNHPSVGPVEVVVHQQPQITSGNP